MHSWKFSFSLKYNLMDFLVELVDFQLSCFCSAEVSSLFLQLTNYKLENLLVALFLNIIMFWRDKFRKYQWLIIAGKHFRSKRAYEWSWSLHVALRMNGILSPSAKCFAVWLSVFSSFLFLLFFHEKKMILFITTLLIAAVVPPWVQGQFPRACINLSSLKDQTCCPVPQGFTNPCGTIHTCIHELYLYSNFREAWKANIFESKRRGYLFTYIKIYTCMHEKC